MNTARAVAIRDLRETARRRLPRAVFDYIDGGADAELTLGENYRAFERLAFRPRCAVITPAPGLRTTVLGTQLSLPFALAPIGSSRLFYPRAEEAAARAAGQAGIAYTLSTFSGCLLEDVRRASAGPVWYQLYLAGGRECATAALQRARTAGYTALLVTIDTAVAGMRERDLRNGIPEIVTRNPLRMAPFVTQFLSRPRWLAGFLRDGGLMSFPNVVLPTGPMRYADVGKSLEQSMVTWEDLRWIRGVWDGPLVVKGVQTADDARRAAAEGADGVVVSNHGGRQLDGVRASLHVLPDVVEAVGSQIEVLMDGGIRRGSDIVKALCLGARAVLVGRAYSYGLAAAGGAGVTRAIEILEADLVRTLKLLGCASIAELNPSYLEPMAPDHAGVSPGRTALQTGLRPA
jgi:L-lactate dehydrogenase (cytochrome)